MRKLPDNEAIRNGTLPKKNRKDKYVGTMREFIISTETNCDLSAEFIKTNNICVIPHYYTVDEEVYGDGKELTNKEFGLLVLFMQNPNVALFRETLYEKVWEGEYFADSRT